jgi:hypothetical protein
MSDEFVGFHKIRARDLSPGKQEELRKALQRELMEALIRAIKVDPPDLDMDSIKLILKPGQRVSKWSVVSDCGTCATCDTCNTCNTCSTQAFPPDVPASVLRKLGLKTK